MTFFRHFEFTFFNSYRNIKFFKDLPEISLTTETVKSFTIDGTGIIHFQKNISGIVIENLLNSMINAKNLDMSNRLFLWKNKRKLKFIGKAGEPIIKTPVLLNKDGTISAIRKEDEAEVAHVNNSTLNLKAQIQPVIEYIENNIFKGSQILTQEMVLNKKQKVLALCDLSNSYATLEIKTNYFDVNYYKYELYYESNGRDTYILRVKWGSDLENHIEIVIDKIIFHFAEKHKNKFNIIETPHKNKKRKNGAEISNLCVALDVETNGFDPKEYDLLSISIYKPDDGKKYNRFLPLELNSRVLTTYVNGITENDLVDKNPLTQAEVDKVINSFELNKRTILTYGTLDKTFIKAYFERNNLKGFEKLNFYNIQNLIMSWTKKSGKLTKDDLCRFFKISNVQNIHSSLNDCILGWELFEKIKDQNILVIGEEVFSIKEGYKIPAHYIDNVKNIYNFNPKLPHVDIRKKLIKKEIIECIDTKTVSLMSLGSLRNHIYKLLDVKYDDKTNEILKENNNHIEYLGLLHTDQDAKPLSHPLYIYYSKHPKEDSQTYLDTNNVENLFPLVLFIKSEIFNNEEIIANDIVEDNDKGVIAINDLSSENSILEIRIGEETNVSRTKQMYFGSNGRNCYLLDINFANAESHDAIIFSFYRVTFAITK